jgi:recombinational DNA repair protein (RecF pathway)
VTTLDALENANEELCPRLLVHFLWRWAGFLGIQPQVESCSSCGNEAVNSPLWFSSSENAVFCGDCVSELCPQALSPKSSPQNGLLQLNFGCRRWLAAVSSVEPSNLHRYSMDNRSFSESKALATAVITGALGKRLASWDW